ncbi:hypothetical protein AVEN_182162-1 [Araneus ventricosus]|uniref:Uncharacterized protein n=1 Tax=Araneus ventricosus TaxID=182803 RepID=A0A4Y2W3X8_ARAVE|nr:hypothetical protein AVEN_182162-1 [Araneus ventricosus]
MLFASCWPIFLQVKQERKKWETLFLSSSLKNAISLQITGNERARPTEGRKKPEGNVKATGDGLLAPRLPLFSLEVSQYPARDRSTPPIKKLVGPSPSLRGNGSFLRKTDTENYYLHFVIWSSWNNMV